MLKPWDKRGLSPPSGSVSLHACCCLKHGLNLAIYDFGQKGVYLHPLCCFNSLVQVSQISHLVHSSFTPNEKFCLTANQQAGYPWPIQGSQQLIYFILFDHIDNSINGGCAQSNQHSGPKGSWIWHDYGQLVFIIASHLFYLNPYNNVALGLGE